MNFSKIGGRYGTFFDQAAVLAVVVFLYWGHLPQTVATSIPLALTVYLLFRHPGEVAVAFRETRLVWWLIVLGFGLSTIFSELPIRSIKGVFDFFRGMIVLVPIHWALRQQLEFFGTALRHCLVVSIIVTLGIYFVAWTSGDLHQQRHLLGIIFNQYNNFGTGAGILCLAAGVFSWHLWGRSRWLGGLFGLLSGVSLGLVLLSGSRGSLLSTVVGGGGLLVPCFS